MKTVTSQICLSHIVAEFQNILRIAKVTSIITVTNAFSERETPVLSNGLRLEQEAL